MIEQNYKQLYSHLNLDCNNLGYTEIIVYYVKKTIQ